MGSRASCPLPDATNAVSVFFQWTADLCHRAGKNVSVQCALEQSRDTSVPDVQGKVIDSFHKSAHGGHFRAHREAVASG